MNIPYIKTMRRKERQINETDKITEILQQEHICRIALFDEEFPYMVTMNYGYKDNALYFHCAKAGHKIDLIQKNPKVTFSIEQAHEIVTDEVSCKWTTKYRSLVGKGAIEILEQRESKRKGLDVIMQQHGKMENHYPDKAIDNLLVLKLKIIACTGKQSY